MLQVMTNGITDTIVVIFLIWSDVMKKIYNKICFLEILLLIVGFNELIHYGLQ